MQRFLIPEHYCEVPKNLALIDTNVLIAYHDPSDNLHEQACEFFEAGGDYELLVAPPVIVEACGLLTRRRNSETTLHMLRWLLTPGNVILIPNPHNHAVSSMDLSEKLAWMAKYRLDYVDAYLVGAADYLTSMCNIDPPTPIVTFDTGDFTRCARQGMNFCIFDMRSFELVNFNL